MVKTKTSNTYSINNKIEPKASDQKESKVQKPGKQWLSMSKKMMVLLLCIGLSGSTAFANNIAVSNTNLTGKNTSSDFTLVEFDIAWENSWRVSSGPSNWYAAWVFVKYRKKTETDWHHASLNWVDGTGNGDGHTEPANSNIYSSNDNSGNSHGVFIHRDAAMTQGNVNYTGVQLQWNYGTDGLLDNDSVEVCVFAIEMVYVPEAAFELGDGGSVTGSFYKYPTSTDTYTVSSENEITVGTSSGNLNYLLPGNNSGDGGGPIPAAFPKGFATFYCMKYEISQAQYTEFLNKLTTTQDDNRYFLPTDINQGRHAIVGIPGSRTTTKPYVACNYLGWADLAAYLDWSALRPMTEMEFEKACRGTLPAVADEYAWGTSTAAANAYAINNDDANNEGIAANYSTNAGNSIHSTTKGSIEGPLRCGIFAAHASNTGRVSAGATYYGVMEMSGNIRERPVTLGIPTGRAFTGLHGDGTLNPSGHANTANWPGTDAVGAGWRGGDWFHGKYSHKISDRWQASSIWNGRENTYGGRGVRSAP